MAIMPFKHLQKKKSSISESKRQEKKLQWRICCFTGCMNRKGVNESLGYVFTSLAHTILVLLLKKSNHTARSILHGLIATSQKTSSSHATLKQDCKVNKHWKQNTKSGDKFPFINYHFGGPMSNWICLVNSCRLPS